MKKGTKIYKSDNCNEKLDHKSNFENHINKELITWSGFTDNDLHDLEVIDHSIIRLITGA